MALETCGLILFYARVTETRFSGSRSASGIYLPRQLCRGPQRIRCTAARRWLREFRQLRVELGNLYAWIHHVALLIEQHAKRQRDHAHFVGQSAVETLF